MLRFITDKIWKVYRFNETTSDYDLFQSNIELDIQPSNIWIFEDWVQSSLVCFIYTNNENLVKYNDLIEDDSWRKYNVTRADFFKWLWSLEGWFEVYLTEILTK